MNGARLLSGDEHDERHRASVRPASWTNPAPAPRYNLLVVGGGPAGLVAAAGAAGLGAKVALVERHLLGGDCLNAGCVPSKTLIRSARTAAEMRRAAAFGVEAPGAPVVDFPRVMDRVRSVRARVGEHDSAARFRDLGVDVFLGEGAFRGPDCFAVGDAELRFHRAAVTTGARPAVPPIEGLAAAGYHTNETLFTLTELPRRLLIIGGGPIGCEMAQAFRRLGSEVHLLERSDHFLPREESDAAAVLREVFAREGVRIHLRTEAVRVVRDAGGVAQVVCRTPAGETTLAADALLVAAGRRPNVEGLGLEAAGVAYDERHGIRVDDRLRTSNRRVYAAGDVCMRYKFTHAADAAARLLLQNALFMGRRRLSALTIPWTTYTGPEIAHVGLYPEQAAAEGLAVDVFTRELAEVDRAVCDGETEGYVRLYARRGTDRILGGTIVAAHAGEMIGEVCLAMQSGAGLGALSAAVHPYPTQAEAIRQTGDAYRRTRLTPWVRRLMRAWLRWRRS